MSDNMEQHNLQVKDLNEIFLCIICNGYLIRPVAITECCHYFCRSCIVKYLETTSEYKCPLCDTLIHETNPWDMLREDKKLEFMIFKLVPGLAQNEKKRRALFYTRRGMDDPEEVDADSNLNLCLAQMQKEKEEQRAVKENGDKKEEKPPATDKTNTPILDSTQIGLHLNYIEPESEVKPKEEEEDGEKENKTEEETTTTATTTTTPTTLRKTGTIIRKLDKPYLRASSHITIEKLKKFLQKKLKYTASFDVDILCNGELMGRHHTLEFIYMTRWRYKEGVLTLDYRPKVDL